ncbi:hypothetical protein Fcan01_15441 [Folsomia candida]|uniref:Uncharacterized protein n=1 Tax=Folsomia candida TaxID=158441 RepID=A0A226DYG0_FOLCA|nr:hypothetical protein Fcan01_15441 [Folsomia candida]
MWGIRGLFFLILGVFLPSQIQCESESNNPLLFGFSDSVLTVRGNNETYQANIHLAIPQASLTVFSRHRGHGSYAHTFTNVSFWLNLTVSEGMAGGRPLVTEVATALNFASARLWAENYSFNDYVLDEAEWESRGSWFKVAFDSEEKTADREIVLTEAARSYFNKLFGVSFVHLRNLHLYFDQLPAGEVTLDLTGFDKLVSLAITPHELGVIFDTWKTLERNETPVDLEFPEACKITKLDLRGLIMKDSFWTGLHERVPTLMEFTYCVAHAPISLIDPKSFTRLDSLQFLSLNVPINYWNDDVMTLLWHTGGPFRLHLANVQDSDVAVVDELVNLRILGSFQTLEWIAHKRDRVWIEVEFANYQQEDIHAEERATVSQQSKNFKIDWKNVHAEINAANEAEDDEYGEEKEPLPAKWVLKAVYKCD